MILEIVVLAIFVATLFNIILNRFNMPTIIGYIITWTIITYAFWLQEIVWNKNLKEIAEFGIVFLMFTIGLEFSFKNLVKMKREVFLLWSLQFFITATVFFFMTQFFFELTNKEAIIVAVWLSLSSTAIVLKLLNENGDINKTYWNKALGILIFQDLMVIPILLLITVFSDHNTSLPVLLWETFISALVLLLILWVVGRYLLDIFIYRVVKTNSNEIFIWSILFIIIWAAALAHSFGFSYSLWAFIAWMLIAETHYKYQVEADLIPFRDILLGFFFVTVWMQLNVDVIFNYIWIIFVLLLLFLLVKTLVIYYSLVCFWPKRSVFKTALSLFQFWEFGIVVFELASIKNLIDPSMSQILIVAIIFSMILTPFMLKKVTEITDFFFWHKYLAKDDCVIKKKLSWHVVLIWYGRLWKLLLEKIEKKKMRYVVIENSIKNYKEAKRNWKNIIYWNAFQANTLKSVNIESASTILISIWKSKKLYLISNLVKKMNLDWNIVVKVNNFEEERMLKELWIHDIIVETEKTGNAMFNKVSKKKE